MIRPNKYNEDGLPVELDWKDSDVNEDGLPIVKKKILTGGGVGSFLQGVGSAVGNGLSQSNGKVSEKQKVLDYLYSLKSPQEKALTEKPKVLTQVGFKKNENPFEPTEKDYTKAYDKINEVMLGDNEDWKDPIKSLQNKYDGDIAGSTAAINLTQESLMPSGYKALRVLSDSHFANEGEGNLTANMLKYRVDRYNKVAQPFRELGNINYDDERDFGTRWKIYDSAIRAYANKNPHFEAQAQAAGIDLNGNDLLLKLGSDKKSGQIMADILNDPDLLDYVQNENPNLLPSIKKVSDDLIYDNKEYGKVQLANEISREMERSGYNKIDPIFNFKKEAKESGDATAKALYVSDPKKLQFYEENNGEILNMLDAPSLLEGFAGGAKRTIGGIKNTFTVPFESIPTQIKDNWEKEASHVSADPKGLVNFLRNTGDVLGLVATIGATGNVLGGGGVGVYSRNVVPAISGSVPFFGDMLETATSKYPNSPVKAWVSAITNTAMYAALSQSIFPASKAAQAIKQVEPSVSKVIENLTSGRIKREVARRELQTITKKAIDFAGGSVLKSAKISGELTAIGMVDKALDKIMGLDKTAFEQYHPQGQEVDTFGSMFLSNLVLGGMVKFGEMKRGNRIVEESLYSAATNPKRFERVIESIDDPSLNKEQMLSNLKFVSDTKAVLDSRGVDERNQKRYLFNALKNRIALEERSKLPDENLVRKHDEENKRFGVENDKILNGEDIVGDDIFENNIKTPEGKLLKKAIDSGDMKDKLSAETALKTEGGVDMLLKEIADQALNKIASNESTEEQSLQRAKEAYGEELTNLAIKKFPEIESPQEPMKEDTPTAQGASETPSTVLSRGDMEVENRMTEIQDKGNKATEEENKEFDLLEKEMEKRERATVFNVPLVEAKDAIDALMKKEKEMPNGWGSFITKQDASESKSVIDDYSNPKEISDSQLKKDFKDALMGRPATWYADGLKLRESMNEAANRGIDINDMLKEVESEFTKEGYDIKTAKDMVAYYLKPVFEGSQKVNEKQIAAPSLSSNTPSKEQPTVSKVAEQKEKKETAQSRAKKVYRDIGEVDEPVDARGAALAYFAGGGKLSEASLNSEVVGKAKRATLNTGAKEKRGEEAKVRDYITKDGMSIDEIAHSVWEGLPEDVRDHVTTQDIRNELIDVANSHNTRLSAAMEFRDRYIAKDVMGNLSEAEAKEMNDLAIAKRTKIVQELPEIQQTELLQLIEKYEDKYGNVDWAKLEKDSNGFDPDILSLSTETQQSLDAIIQKNISEAASESRNTSDKDGVRKKEEAEERLDSAISNYNKAVSELAKAENKISNTQASQSKLFDATQKEMFVVDRDAAKEILDPLRKKVKETKSELDDAQKAFDNISEQPELNLETTVSKVTEQGVLASSGKGVTSGQTKKDGILERLSPEEERGRIEGGKTNVEASKIATRVHQASEGAKDGIGDIRQREESELEKYAKEEGVWVDDPFKEFGETPHAYGAEQNVYMNKDGVTVTKINGNALHDTWLDFFDRIAIHNSLFPDTKYTLKGFTNLSGDFSAILEQPYIEGSPAKAVEVKEDLAKRGFELIPSEDGGGKYDFRNKKTGVLVFDVHGENVIKDKEGNLHYIDPVIHVDTPEQGYGGTRKIKNETSTIKEADTGDKQSELPSKEKSQSTESVIEEGEGAKEPPKPPAEGDGVTGGEGDVPLKNKSLATRLVEAKNTPDAAKTGIEKEGLKYKPQSREEAEGIAKSIIDELGMDEAVKQAQAQNFGGDVNTLIQTESLNRLYDQELTAKTSEEKFNTAEKFADIAIKLDEWARDKAGRGISALDYFYKKSPLGMIIKHNKEQKQSFDKWAKPKEKSWDEFLDEVQSEPAFKEFVDKKVQDELKKERVEQRKEKKDKVHKAIDNTMAKWAKKLSADLPPGTQKQGFGDIEKVMKAVGATMKAAYDAGEAVAKVIQDAITEISKIVDGDWGIENFKKEAESFLTSGHEKKNSLDRYKDNLNRQIADLDKQIAEKKRKVTKQNKTELDKEAEELVKKRDAKKKELEEIAPLSETEEHQLRQLEKFRKKLKGLSESQKDEVIRKSFKELIENGALKQEDFRRIIAQATGRGDLTAAQSAKMKELVAHTNAVETFAKRLRERKTPQSYENYQKAQLRAAKASKDLSDMFDKKADYMKVIAASVQGSTLTLSNVLVLNPLFNLVNQLSTRLPIGALQSLYGVIANKPSLNTVLSTATQKQFFRELLKGLKEANVQLATGMNRLDYDSKEIYTDKIRPFKSAREIGHQIRSSKFGNTVARMFGGKEIERREHLTKNQKAHRALQVFPGTPAEIIFRLLNYGDKPMRFGAGGATAAAFAESLGIKSGTMDWNIFLEFPREEAYRTLRAQGKSEKEASEKADYIRESILQEGKRSTLQQDNLFVDFINGAFNTVSAKLGGQKDSGVSSLIKASTISPYIKIPSNAFWSFFNVAHPLIAVAQSTGHVINAKRLRGNGENVKADLQLREARYWAGHAAVGIALNMVAIALVKSGTITPSTDEDDPKKEREGKKAYEQGGTIKMFGLYIPLKMLGSTGMLFNAVGKDYEDMTPEQRENRSLLMDNLLEFWDTDDLKELQNGIFSNSAGLLGALGEGGTNTNRFLINQINMYANLVQPAAIAQISRAANPNYTTRKADSFLAELDNSFLERSALYRKLRGKYPPTKYTIWGQPMKKDDNFIFRLLGISKANKDNFAQPLYEDAKKYNDNGFFPPAITDKIGEQKLTAEQYDWRQKLVGAQRMFFIGAFVNDGMKFPVVDKFYSELNPEQKKKAVSTFSDISREIGDEKLFEKYPELKKTDKSIEERVKDMLDKEAMSLMELQIKTKTNE